MLFLSCSQQYQVTKIAGKNTEISNELSLNTSIEAYIKPYRERITKDLDSVLGYNPKTLDKSIGEWQTSIGNFMADVCFQKATVICNKRFQKSVDICLLNHGGIRSIIPQGNITTRTAFEVMPFENNLVVIALKGEQLIEMVNYFVQEKKPHPLAGIKIYLDHQLKVQSIVVGYSPLEVSKIYYVATSDYLSNGGDNMTFFLKNEGTFDVDYKIRNVLIDYFKEIDTLSVSTEKRIFIE